MLGAENLDPLKVLLAVGQAAKQDPLWVKFSEFCFLREQGIKERAFACLAAFLDEAERWPFEEKRRFVLWMREQEASFHYSQKCFPQPLHARLIKPTFEEWLGREPGNAELQFISEEQGCNQGGYKRAIELDLEHQGARLKLSFMALHYVSVATHNLPDHFYGTTEEAKACCTAAREHLGRIKDEAQRSLYLEETAFYERMIEDWIAFKAGGEEDFRKWCEARGRKYRWVKAYYYKT